MSASSRDLAAAIIAALDDHALDALADRLIPRLTQRIARTTVGEPYRWLDTRQAAEYAGCGVSTLQRAAAAGEIESCQECEYGKRWFRSEWIDQWRTGATRTAAGANASRGASKTLPKAAEG